MESQLIQAIGHISSAGTNQTSNTSSAVALERHYSVPELANIWVLSENTVRRIFLEEPVAALVTSDLAQLMAKVQSASVHGRNLLAEMAADVRAKISIKRMQFEKLSGEAKSV